MKTAARTRAGGARPTPPAVPGGKALARLRQFEDERGLETSDVGPVSGGRSSARATAQGRTTGSPARRQPTDGAGYLAAFEHVERLVREAPAMPVPQGWRPLGPFSVPHGQTYGLGPGSRPSISGRISAIAVDPADDNHLLIGAAGGGVWETRDLGATWNPRTDNQPSLATGALAFDPNNPATVYAGTGEGNFFFRLGAGLLRSTDGGATWAVRASSPFVGTGFYDLLVDPLDSNHLLSATWAGVHESTNGGTTWTSRRGSRAWDLSMHPPIAGDANSTRELFAGGEDGVFRSTNGGTTWTAVALPGAPASYQRIALCHAPSDGNVVYIFAAGPPMIPNPDDPRQQMPTAYLWRRDAFGSAFTAIAPDPALRTGQAWYDWFVAVAPNNPDVIYLGAINTHRGTRSGGGTWTWLNITAKSSGDSIHPDQHTIAFSPTNANVVYIGCDGGIFRSPDAGITWQSLNKGLCITEFEYLAQHPQYEAWLVGGTQDNGSMRYEGAEVWYHIQDGDGGDCGTNAVSPYTCYHSFYSMGMERSTTGGGWGSWSWIGPNTPDDYNALFYPPVEVNGNVVAQAGATLFISSDSGTTWTEVALPGGAGVASALEIPTSTRLYVGTTNGRVYRTDFAGGAWGTPVALTQPRAGFVSDLSVDPTNPNRIWGTYSNLTGSHVFRSDDAGTTWNNVSAGLPAIPVNALAIDPDHPDTVWVAADVGVYRSLDAGATWTVFSNLLPNALAKDLVFHQPSRLLRVATQSRGVWEIAVDSGTIPDVEAYLRDSRVDTGRVLPSPSGINDPFNAGSLTNWWECADIKVDSPPYQESALADVDFVVFEDDHGVAAAGLIHENTQRNRIARVYAQVHNRGTTPATSVAVKLFFTDASLGLPDLPAGFWTNFPNNVVAATSPWQPIAPHQVVPSVEAGRARIAGFAWAVPATAADHSCLLAVVSADNDSIATSELNVPTLVLNNKKCSLKNLAVVDPPPLVGPRVKIVKLNLWGSRRWRKYSFGTDRGAAPIIRGAVLSRRLSQLARQARLQQVPLRPEEKGQLDQLVKEFPNLKDQLDLTVAYRSTRRGPWLKSFELDGRAPEPIVVLVDPNPRAGQWALVQWAEDGTVVGGFTLQARGLK